MPAPRFDCPSCTREVALMPNGRIYRHDPPERGKRLVSCPSSLKMARPPKKQAVLFEVEEPMRDVKSDIVHQVEQGDLF